MEKLADEARKPKYEDRSIGTCWALQKSKLKTSTKVWGGSPKENFPIQAAFHQLRSGNVKLNAFQSKCRQAPYPIWETCNVRETTDHYLISCRRFVWEGSNLGNTLKKHKINDIATRKILKDKSPFEGVANFIKHTALRQFREDGKQVDGHHTDLPESPFINSLLFLLLFFSSFSVFFFPFLFKILGIGCQV